MLRQDEARRRSGEREIPLRDRVRRLLSWPFVIAVSFWGGASLIVLSGDERLPFYLGQEIEQPILSRINFERVNQSRTAEARKTAQQEVPDYFRLNHRVVDGVASGFRDLFAAVKAVESFEQFGESHGKRWTLDREGYDALNAMGDDAGSAAFQRDVDQLSKRLTQRNMIERADIEREIRSTAGVVQLERGDGVFVPVAKERLIYAVNSDHVDRLAQDLVRDLFPSAVRPTLVSIVKNVINPPEGKPEPLFVYDVDQTKAKLEEAAALPPVKDSFQMGDRLVKPGVLDGEMLALLKAEHEEYLKQRNVEPRLLAGWRKKKAGIFGMIALLTAGLAVYTYRCQPRIAQKPTRALALAGLLLVMLFADRLVLTSLGTSPIWSVAAVTMTAAILTIAYSQIFAIGMTAGLALLLAVTEEVPDGLLVVFLSVAAVVILLLGEIRTRLRMVEIGGVTALVAAVSTTFLGLVMGESMALIASESARAALAALIGASVVLVLLPIIEKVFRITTNLTLLEWADTSNPLLRQLIERAPGTWQHSHLIGSIAESAAEEIDANGLLVRVGAYYHDIGKMCKPAYYVENQETRENAHRNLAPTMSLLVILAHVKDGLALAKEHSLPTVLHQFIAEHHGTTVVKYFHAMAEQEVRSGRRDEREADETEFRYPGPKPRSRESAILMICDGVEGAVRSLQDPTAGRIETVVHEIIMDRLMDGQFDDCDITLKELAGIEESIVRSLRAIHHGRIAYPKGESLEPRPPMQPQVRRA